MERTIIKNWSSENVIAGYTTESGGLFRYMNPQDEKNYEALARDFGLRADRLVRVHEEHTDNIFVAEEGSGGEGIMKNEQTGDYDGITTDAEDIMLCIVTADCVPVFLHDPVKNAIALAHSGRVGTGKEIALKAVLKMTEEFGSDPKNIRCMLGPYLCKTHHVVHHPDIILFSEHFSPDERDSFLTVTGDQIRVDMGRAIAISLTRSGVPAENISDCGICTYEHKELYSWRRDHDPDAHILSFILMKHT